MTTSPDHPSPTPLPPTTDAPQPRAVDDALDAGTYDRIREPRSAGRLALDGDWHQISRKYLTVQLITDITTTVIVAAAAIVLAVVFDQTWLFFVAGAVVALEIAMILILPRQVRAIGYQLRADDIVFRKGILWQRMVAVPYGRMQLVDITHGPLDRGFGIAKLKLVTAAATTGVEIPGLTQEAAEALRDTLIEVAEDRRTGL